MKRVLASYFLCIITYFSMFLFYSPIIIYITMMIAANVFKVDNSMTDSMIGLIRHINAYLVIAFGFGSGLFALMSARYCMKWCGNKFNIDKLPSRNSWLALIIVAFIMTGVFGIPSAIKINKDRAERAHATYKTDWDGRIPHEKAIYESEYIVPVAPMFVLCKHYYSLAPLHAWGGWELYLWLPSGIRPIIRLTEWIS